jgi:transcription termination factor NusB
MTKQMERRKNKWYYNPYIVFTSGCIISLIISACYSFILTPKQMQEKIMENRFQLIERKMDDVDQKIKNDMENKFDYIQKDIKEIKDNVKTLIKMHLKDSTK